MPRTKELRIEEAYRELQTNTKYDLENLFEELDFEIKDDFGNIIEPLSTRPNPVSRLTKNLFNLLINNNSSSISSLAKFLISFYCATRFYYRGILSENKISNLVLAYMHCIFRIHYPQLGVDGVPKSTLEYESIIRNNWDLINSLLSNLGYEA